MKLQIPVLGKPDYGLAGKLHEATEKAYHKQFNDYISHMVPIISSKLAIKYAERAGISAVNIDYQPEDILTINSISQHYSTYPIYRPRTDLTKSMRMPAYIVDGPNGKYFFIAPDGRIREIKKTTAQAPSDMDLLALLNKKPTKSFHGMIYLQRDVEAKANVEGLSIRQIVNEKIAEDLSAHVKELEQKNEPDEWKAKVEIIEEILEDTALAASVLALPVLAPEGLALEAEIEAVEAVEIEGAAAEGAVAEAGAAAVVPELNAAKGASAFIEDDVALSEDANALAEEDPLYRCRRGNACTKGIDVAPEDPTSLLARSYDVVAARHGVTPEFIANVIDKEAAEKIPEYLYRGQSDTVIRSSWGKVGDDKLDDYLVSLLKHTGNTEGGEGASLSMNMWVANEFATARLSGKILKIETNFDRANFRSAADLIKNEGPRLVAQGKLDQEVLSEAIDNMIVAQRSGMPEKEVFYIRGRIPDEWVQTAGAPI